MSARNRFTGGDQAYLRDEQYGDASRLAARAAIHEYGTASKPLSAWLIDQLEWVDGGEVLDVGCGPGWLWERNAAALPALRVSLVDVSPAMVAEAESRVGALEGCNVVTTRAADAQALPFGDASFDVVMANYMLYHVPDPSRAVAELARVVRPDGVVLAATNGPRSLRELWAIRHEVFPGGPDASDTVEIFGSLTGRPLLTAVFDEVEWRQYHDELRVTDPAVVVGYLTSTPPGEDATPTQRAALEVAVAARFDDGGTFTVTKDTGAFVARSPLR